MLGVVFMIEYSDIIKLEFIKDMHQLNKIGFVSNLLLIFLLPIFFFPSQIIPLGLAKSLLVVVSAAILFSSIILIVFKSKRFSLPNTKILLVALLLPIIYIASAVLNSDTVVLSLFGYALEVGTTGSILALSIIFFSSVYFFRDRAKLIRAVAALFFSMALVAVFSLIKVLTGGSFLTLGMFFGRMGNPVGGWTDLAMVFGLLSLVTIFASEMLPLSKKVSLVVKALFFVSLFLLVVTNFSTIWGLVLVFALILIVYFGTVEKLEGVPMKKRPGVRMAFILAVVSLLLLVNPKIGSRDLAERISSISGVVNTDVRPNLKSTFNVTKQVLSEKLLLGSGPNTFDKDWLKYKAPETNSTPFWNLSFLYGFGFLPTVGASVGILGVLAWAVFLVLFFGLGIKSISKTQESRSDKFVLVSTFLTSAFLWIGIFLYPPSLVVMGLAFISTGLFVGATEAVGVVSPKEIVINRNKISQFASYLVMIFLVVGVGSFIFVSAKKILAATHFQRALVYSNTPTRSLVEVESELGKAITTSPSDPFWIAVSQVQLIKVNNVINNPQGSDEENQRIFQDSLSAGIAAIQNAISLNPSYQNWIALGNIYSSLVPKPLAIEGAYESAQAAYKSAQAVHPLSPEVSLLLARLEYDRENIDGAREFIAEAIAKKSDYAEAYFLLSQLEVSQNNLDQAIESAETSALLLPGNPGVFFQLGLLKYSDRDYDGAIEAFVRALTLVPEYANAKYYLALSLNRVGKKSEALQFLEDLKKTNPDNSSIEDAIDNISGNKASITEESKTTPPIQGQ